MRNSLIAVSIAGVLLSCAGDPRAQIRGVTATLTPLVERDAVAGGQTVRAALQVALPEGFHVQSDEPRDPTLIPTVLTVSPPEGVTVTEIVYPASVDLRQVGIDQPLAVFERVFPIGVQLTLPRSVTGGEIVVAARLRYQACNDTTCFAPTTADAEWRLRVAPAAARGPRQHADVFDRIAFGRGKPPAIAPRNTPLNAADLGGLEKPAAATDAVRASTLDDFTILATGGGYLNKSDFLTFIDNAERGVKEPGLL
jgi:thioredoxin:protein disulfide reductase